MKGIEGDIFLRLVGRPDLQTPLWHHLNWKAQFLSKVASVLPVLMPKELIFGCGFPTWSLMEWTKWSATWLGQKSALLVSTIPATQRSPRLGFSMTRPLCCCQSFTFSQTCKLYFDRLFRWQTTPSAYLWPADENYDISYVFVFQWKHVTEETFVVV